MSVDSPCLSSMSVRLVECVRTCLRHENCRSLTFHSKTRDCRLFGLSFQRSVTKVSTSDLKYGLIKPEKVEVVLTDEKLSWTKANRSCITRGGQLYKINSEEKQAIAEALVKEKHYPYVYIGVHWNKWLYNWVYGNEEIITYSNWDKDEGYQFALYVALMADKDYKWTPVIGTPYPYLCEVIS